MKTSDFPLFGTKTVGLSRSFDLSNPEERKIYFKAKAGNEITKIKKYLSRESFMANMVGKKNSGKGTYSQLFAEAVGKEKVALISVGDMVRGFHGKWESFSKGSEIKKLEANYRGFISFNEAVERFLGRSTKNLVPTEFILALLKYSIDHQQGKAIFIDGLPRELDQVSYSLYFRDLIDYRDDQDLFVLIDIPEELMDLRIRTRTICPKCQSSKNIKTNPTKFVGYDEKQKQFYLMCDNPACQKARFVNKEGDEQGIMPIKARLEREGKVLDLVNQIHGVPKVFLRNSVPKELAGKYFDDYEIAPGYEFKVGGSGEIHSTKHPLTFLDDDGMSSVTTYPAAITVVLIKQLVSALGL